MSTSRRLVSVLAVLALVLAGARSLMAADASTAPANAHEAVKALYDAWARAFEARDLEGIMALYAPGDALVAYDIVPPLQYKGTAAYRKNYADFLAQYEGTLHIEYRDLRILTSGSLAVAHGLELLSGTLKGGNHSATWVRFTSVARRIGGKWLIVHDHVSVPTDFESGKALLSLTP